jgi:hypothetical protein
MKSSQLRTSALVAAVAAMLSGIAVAQSPSLMQPNNSAGTPDGIPGAPPTVLVPAPAMTESSLTAFEKLDTDHRGYVTRKDTGRLSGHIEFDSADRNHDGRLDVDEFQRAWSGYRSGGQ